MRTGFKIGESSHIVIDDFENVDLSNLDFVLLMTCETGMGFDPANITNNTPQNIIEQLVICGAETVVGFSDSTYVADCNRLAPDLTELLLDGLSIQNAINSINYASYLADMSDIAEIAGNADNTLR